METSQRQQQNLKAKLDNNIIVTIKSERNASCQHTKLVVARFQIDDGKTRVK